ncbi:MAG: TonB-dependent receptor plug domain-containing protein [Rhodothermaceae bacterium]
MNRFFAVCLFAISFTFSQQVDYRNLSIEELMSIPVRVASHTSESLLTAPSSVSLISGKEIEQLGFQNLVEFLNYIPGFVVTRDVDGAHYRISVRGRSTATSESVLILLNGVPVNSLFTGGTMRVIPHISSANIKQVEIIRGPGSAIYGANAFLAVINVITGVEKNKITVNAGSYKRKEFSANFTNNIDEIKVTGFAEYYEDRGEDYSNVFDERGNLIETNDPESGLTASLQIKYKSFKMILSHYVKFRENFFVFGDIENNTNRQKSSLTIANLFYDHKFSKKVNLRLNTSAMFDKLDEKFLLTPAGVGPFKQNFIGGPQLESFKGRFNAEVDYTVSKNLNILSGFFFESTGFQKIESLFSHHPLNLTPYGTIKLIDDQSILYIPDEKRFIIGGYVQSRWEINSALRIFAGIRFDNYNDFGSTFSPRFSAIYETKFNSVFKVMYGEAFRAPNYIELYNKNVPTRIGNPDLDPEKIRTYEFSYTYNNKDFLCNITYFKNDISNLIILGDERPDIPENPLNAPQYTQIDKTIHRSGIESEINLKIAKFLDITGSYTHLFERDDTVPENFFSAAVNLKYKKINFNINSFFREKTETVKDQDSYIVVNTKIKYSFTPKLHLNLHVNNLFDEEFYTVNSAMIYGVPNKGRKIRAGFELLF